MNNQYAVLISSEIPELGELDLLRSICRELNGYMEDYNNQINLDNLGEAIVNFCVVKCWISYSFPYFYMHKGL